MTTNLAELTAELEAHVAHAGWDQPPRLYALVRTGDLLASEPQLAPALAAADPDGLTPVEQEPVDGDLLAMLDAIAWPDAVSGCAIVNEVFMLPAAAEAGMPGDAVPEEWAAAHPDRRDVRIVLAVTRDGGEIATLRVRGRDGAPDQVMTSPGLVPSLSTALIETLAGSVTDEAAR